MSAWGEKGDVELRRFGWELGPTFRERYLTDVWVFSLVNALGVVASERDAAADSAERAEVKIAAALAIEPNGTRDVAGMGPDGSHLRGCVMGYNQARADFRRALTGDTQ